MGTAPLVSQKPRANPMTNTGSIPAVAWTAQRRAAYAVAEDNAHAYEPWHRNRIMIDTAETRLAACLATIRDSMAGG
jgi:hypothetical protein